MKIGIKYFGMLAEITNLSVEVFQVADGITIGELDTVLKEKYSKFKDLDYQFALNQNLVKGDEIIPENSELALLPPFAGG